MFVYVPLVASFLCARGWCVTDALREKECMERGEQGTKKEGESAKVSLWSHTNLAQICIH